MVQDPAYPNNYLPILATDHGLWVEKDIQTYGALFTSSDPGKSYGGGAILMGHGFTGPGSPPRISLTDSELEYPSGYSFPGNPSSGDCFNHLGYGHLYRYDGSQWIEAGPICTGYFNTLFLKKADGSTPAHLDLGDLTAHGDVYVNDLSPVPEQEWIDVHAKLRINGDLQLVDGKVASSLNPVTAGLGLGSPTEPWDGVVALNGYFDALYFSKLNPDVKLYRSAANVLATNDDFKLIVGGGDNRGLALQRSGIDSRIYFTELYKTYGFSLIYASDANPTFDGTSFTLPDNNLYILRHDNSETGSIVMNFARTDGIVRIPTSGSSGGIRIGGDVDLYRSQANRLYTPDDVYVAGTFYCQNDIYLSTDTHFHRESNGVASLQNSSGQLGVFNTGGLFVSWVNSTQGGGIYFYDSLYPTDETKDLGGLASGKQWNYVWANYLRYDVSSQSFDALDDLALVKNYKLKKVTQDDVEIDVIDFEESLPFLLDEHGFKCPEKINGFLLGCIKKLV